VTIYYFCYQVLNEIRSLCQNKNQPNHYTYHWVQWHGFMFCSKLCISDPF
jgi:hypothetical protein